MYDWEMTQKMEEQNYVYQSFSDFEYDRSSSSQLKYSLTGEDNYFTYIHIYSEEGTSWDVKICRENRSIT